MSKNIGIDLGKDYIKLVCIDDKRLELEIEDKDVYQLEYENDKEYFELVEECIKEFTKKNGIKLAKLHFTLSPDAPFILHGFYDVPKLRDRDITKALKYEIQSNVDYNINNYTLRWTKLRDDRLDENINVFVVAIKDKVIEYISNLSKFTWVISSIELQPLEFAKLFTDTTSILDVGQDNVRAYLYENNKIIDIISREYSNNIIEVSKDILRELETKNLKPIDKVYVPGFYGDNTEFIKDLKESIHIPTYPLGLSVYDTDNTPVTNEIIEEELNNEYDYILTTDNETLEDDMNLDMDTTMPIEESCIGKEAEYIFAVNAIRNKNKTINFSTKTINFNFNNILLSAAITVIIVNIGLTMIANNYDKLTNSVNQANSTVQHNIEQLESEIYNYNSDIDLYNDTIKKVDAIQSQKSWLSDMLYTIEKNTPKSVSLSNIDIIEGKTTIEGYAKDYRDIAYFAMALEKYGEVEINQLGNSGADARLNGDKLVRAFTIQLDHNGMVINQETKN